LILSIGEWVLRTACRQAKAWSTKACPWCAWPSTFPDSSSCSGISAIGGLHHPRDRHRTLDAGAGNHRIGGHEDEAWAEQALAQLKELGVMLAIDDFGTGYSSFGRLRHFAVDRLKIDRSFMTSLIDCSDDRAIAAAIIAMSRSLRINVTAEGVESFPQLLFLQEHDCHEAQGFLFSRALPVDDAHKLLRRAADSRAAAARAAENTDRLGKLKTARPTGEVRLRATRRCAPAQYVDIALCNRVRVERAVGPVRRVRTLRGADRAVDDEVRHVYPMRPELARGALRQPSQGEFTHGESRGLREAFDARGRAGEQDRAAPERQHAFRRLLGDEKAAVSRG